jgi:hypothetical protein
VETSRREFAPGFRLSVVDVIVLVAGSVGVCLLWPTERDLAFIIAFVVGHFFLFCNVFRVARPLELVWAAWLIFLTAGTLTAGTPSWPISIVATLAATVLVIALQMRQPSYHGIGWQWINPHLRTWWDSRFSDAT